jgi:NADH-quinone oxidoreductase subunit G
VRPLGDTRPGWKVLRVLGNLLSLQGFDYEASEQVRTEVLGTDSLEGLDLSGRLNNVVNQPLPVPAADTQELQRVADVPLYFSDAIVRRSASLQQTADARAPRAIVSAGLAQQLGVTDGASVRVKQGSGAAVLACEIDASLPANVVRVAAGHPSTAALGAMFGAISVEKA